MFLDFFVQKGHREVHSSSLLPGNDPTLLFTNAGMNQFKDVFLGAEKRDYTRATSSQKCVRAGGKHNDLENVGFTNRHHTFFEMLGNFSFGDYFKQEAIAYAWELVTSPQWFAIAKDRLYVTIFRGEGLGGDIVVPRDGEAHDLWLKAGVQPDRIFELGMKENFWQMGDTGPCGPCSEIHYDMGIESSDRKLPECAAGECKFPCECGRYVEIWNLVFMQFDRNSEGVLNPLPKPSIDTGAGLERVTAVLQGVVSNYDTDLFVPLIERAAKLTGKESKKTEAEEEKAHHAGSLRVIADHARAATFLISDGILPANEGRGYVLRKIIRRAIRHGRLLGQTQPFLYKMVDAVVKEMAGAYPELKDSQARVGRIIEGEETRFANTVAVGLTKLQELLDSAPEGVLQGKEAFKLYDTFGLPLDFMVDAARDQGIEFDQTGFAAAMEEQKSRAKASWKGGSQKTASPVFAALPHTVFEGYRQEQSSDCEVLAIVHNGQGVRELAAGEHGEIVLDHTPFYSEAGGQVGDKGWLYSGDYTVVVAEVEGVHSPVQGVRAHKVTARHPITVGDKLVAVVNSELRAATMRHHTATHLLHAALRQVLGTHVKQAGSLVAPNHLRFDFAHFTGVADEELQEIEDITNRQVLANQKLETIVDVPIDVAINEYHAMALFGEKYGDKVRVIKIGDFSTELCGGTHVGATGEIGLVKLLKESSVSSGVRRVEAVAGEHSLRHFRRDHELEGVVSTFVGRSELSPAEALRQELERRDEELKKLRKELDQARMKSAASAVASAEENVREVKGIKVLAHRADNLDRSQLRTLVDNFRNKLGSGVVIVGSVADGKVAVIVGVTKDLTGRLQAGKIIGQVAQKVGGSGGGRPDMAEAGGKNPEALDQALRESYATVEAMLG
jgi:alanyl-tRNA synthetase